MLHLAALAVFFALLLGLFPCASFETAAATGRTTSSYWARRYSSTTIDAQFGAVIAACNFPSSARVLHVSRNTSGNTRNAYGVRTEFSTIQAAVNAARSGDVIAIEPGTYKESVDCHDKTIHLIGRSRDDCIIQYPTTDYFKPPLAMSAGSLRSLTVHGTKGKTKAKNTASAASAAIPTAYCLHVDYDNLEGKSLYVENCSFINDRDCAVGIGLWGNSSIEFYNCSLVSTGGGEALYLHDNDARGDATETGQRLMLRGCTLAAATTRSATISIHSQEVGSFVADLYFENNRVYNNADGMLILLSSSTGTWLTSTGYLGSSDFTISSQSTGNNCALMNYTTYAAAYVKYASELAIGQSSANLGVLQKTFQPEISVAAPQE